MTAECGQDRTLDSYFLRKPLMISAVRMRRTTCVVLASIVILGTTPVHSQSPKKIPLAQLEQMFTSMRAQTRWNVDGPLLWGYFFFDPDERKLEQAAAELASDGYQFVSITKVEHRNLYRLHVERVEAHTPASLYARNDQLYALAGKYSIASYDGMDVGPVPAPRK